MRAILVAVAVALVAGAGCANLTGVHVLPYTNNAEDRGPSPSDPETILRDHLLRTLKDPTSLRDFEILQPPMSAACTVGVYGDFHGWRALFQYNARNSFGGYVGTTAWWAWFIGDELVAVIGGDAGFCPNIRPSKVRP